MLQKLFPKNEALVERIIRVVVGLGALSLVFFGPHTNWGWLGLLPLTTGLIGSCPAWTVLGISTNKSAQKPAEKTPTA